MRLEILNMHIVYFFQSGIYHASFHRVH